MEDYVDLKGCIGVEINHVKLRFYGGTGVKMARQATLWCIVTGVIEIYDVVQTFKMISNVLLN